MNRYLLSIVIVSVLLTGCKDPFEGQLFVMEPEDDTKITSIAYMENNPETFSLFLDFLKAANFYNSLNDASVTVTVFAPDNEAMREFMETKDIVDFKELDSLYARQLAQVHLIRDKSISETMFIQYVNEGSIGSPTLFGDNLKLTYGFTDTDVDDAELAKAVPEDTLNVYINNSAKVEEMAHITANGSVYTIGGVIRPLIDNVLQKMQDYGNYTVFLDAIAQAGLNDWLAIETDTVPQLLGGYTVNYINYTVMAVPDEVYAAENIKNVDDLENWLAGKDPDGKKGIARSDSASLIHRYVSYHIVDGARTKESLTYSANPTELKMQSTCEPNEIFTLQTLVGQTTINTGSGYECSFVHSDIKASNGYVHKVSGIMPIYRPEPTEVIWDFCSSSDIISIVNSYGKSIDVNDLYGSACGNSDYTTTLGTESTFGKATSFTYKIASPKSSQKNVGYYKCKADTSQVLGNELNAYLGDLMIVNLGYTGWIEMTTPTIVKGTYRVEFSYAGYKAMVSKYGPGSSVKITIDDYLSKFLMWKGWDKTQMGVGTDVLFQTITFDKTETHTFKAVFMDQSASTNGNYFHRWDCLRFIPIDED